MAVSRKPTAEKKRSWIWRVLLWGTGAMVLLFGIFYAVTLHSDRSARERLAQIIAQLDRTDPNWRLEDFLHDFKPPPESANCTPIVQKILKEKPANWPSATVQEKIGNPAPQRELDSEQLGMLRSEMARSPETVALVRKLGDLRQGYYKINWGPDPIGALLPLVQESREVASIARYDAELRAQEKDYDGALDSCRAILVSGRAAEPVNTMIQALVRFAIEAVCLNQVERTLALGEPSEAALAKLQSLLEDELAQPLLMQGFRSERAVSYRVMENTFKNSNGKMGMLLVDTPALARSEILKKVLGVALAPFAGSMESNQATCLETLTEIVEAMKLPEPEHAPVFARVDAMAKDWRQPILFRLLVPAMSKLHEAHLRNQARLRAGVLAIAAERHRRRLGTWPEKIDYLIPPDLKQAGIDPYDGKPLRLLKLPDGIVIYSVGANRIDDGGMVGQTGVTPDIGFRLWDVKARRQKPADRSAAQPEK